MLVARRNLASLCVQGTRAAAIGAMQSRNISIRGADNSRWGRTRENWDSVLDRFAKVRSSSCCLLYPRGAMFCKQDTCGDGALSVSSKFTVERNPRMMLASRRGQTGQSAICLGLLAVQDQGATFHMFRASPNNRSRLSISMFHVCACAFGAGHMSGKLTFLKYPPFPLIIRDPLPLPKTKDRACAVLRTPAKDSAAKAMQAAIDGGFNIVEFTLTTPGCLDLVADFRKKVILHILSWK